MAAAHPSECAAVVICDRGIGAQMTPAANGTDERLDAVLEELRAIRRALEAPAPQVVHVDHVADAAKAKRRRRTIDPADVIE